MSADHHQHDPKDVHVPHILPLKVYFLVTFALFALTVFTLVTARLEHLFNFDPGQPWNIIIALTIAFTKVLLVALFFMHLYYDSGFMRITFFSGLFFLALFFLLTLVDTETRDKEAKPRPIEIIPAMEGYNRDGTPSNNVKH